ncbi:MAG: hypothetical protein HY225_00680 [Candidatus Vogelbacteria bacterium]|nr:hypothetical protein [Candidatus Vogelbacteria bacterium]
MQFKTGKVQFILFLFLLPVISEAAQSLVSISADFLGIINTFSRIIFGLGIVYFFYGLGNYMGGVDDKKKKEARDTMVYGVIGVFVMVSVWGLVAVVRGIFGI